MFNTRTPEGVILTPRRFDFSPPTTVFLFTAKDFLTFNQLGYYLII